MNEIKKMYENAEVKKQIPKVCSSNELYCKGCKAHIEDAMPYCKNASYPPFTAEKQIKIIEWLGNSKAFFDANETIFSLITNHKDKNGVVKGYEGKGNSVDSCLASLINSLWQDLTEAEKAQVRNILESEVEE